MVLVLDQNFQVAWTWDPFNFLNVRRLPTLGERTTDWTHANSISWSPADGNLLVSLRNQDLAIKIDYANGTGDGHVIWRLGPGGDFQINSTAPSPWFSHQHDVRYINDTTLALFDNGNLRQAKNSRAHSRGQELDPRRGDGDRDAGRQCRPGQLRPLHGECADATQREPRLRFPDQPADDRGAPRWQEALRAQDEYPRRTASVSLLHPRHASTATPRAAPCPRRRSPPASRGVWRSWSIRRRSASTAGPMRRRSTRPVRPSCRGMPRSPLPGLNAPSDSSSTAAADIATPSR